jgi:DNA-binding CsgD family transcriptional regulator
MAKELRDKEILCHALNNVGTSTMGIPAEKEKGLEMLRQSLEMALQYAYHEHAARAYTNLGSNSVRTKAYVFGRQILEEGIRYCEERDLDSWTNYMLSFKARLCLETGNWDEAYRIAESLLKREGQAPIVAIGALAVMAKIKMRRGQPDVLPLLGEGREKAFGALELQRIIPVLTASLEYEWITGQSVAAQEDLDTAIAMMGKMGDLYETSELAFWLLKARKQEVPVREPYAGYQTDTPEKVRGAAALWERLGCPYEQALVLFQCGEPEKQKALELVRQLGAGTVYEKMKREMRASGIKGIPRGLRRNTLSNPALLTQRELDVLGLIREGLQNKEIAARLFISAKTVDHHISSLLFKLDAKSRTKAVQEALKLGILQFQ